MSKYAQSFPHDRPLIRQRQTKILATLGPSSSDIDMIRNLVNEGADLFRLNFSHGKHEEQGARVKAIRQVEKETGRPIGIVVDMQGPKLRVGKFRQGAINLH